MHLREPERFARNRSKLLRRLQRHVLQLLGTHDLIDEPQLFRFISEQRRSRIREVLRTRPKREPNDLERKRRKGNADEQLRHAHPAAPVGHQPPIACRKKNRPAGNRVPVARNHKRRRQHEQLAQHANEQRKECLRVRLATINDPIQIHTRRKNPAHPREDHRPRVARNVELLLERLEQLDVERGGFAMREAEQENGRVMFAVEHMGGNLARGIGSESRIIFFSRRPKKMDPSIRQCNYGRISKGNTQ